MRLLASLLMVLPLVTWFFFVRKRSDLMSPTNVFTILYAFKIIIPTMLLANIENAEFLANTYLKNAVLLDAVFFQYIILQTIGYYFVILGIHMKFILKSTHVPILSDKNTLFVFDSYIQKYKNYKIWGIVFWSIGFVAFLEIISQLGGFYYFLSNLQYRTTLIREVNFLSWLLPFLPYGALLMIYSLRGSGKPLNWKMILFIIGTGFLFGMGGRKAIIMVLLEMIFIYHYSVRKISFKKILNFRMLLIVGVLYLTSIILVNLRTAEAFDAFLSDPILFLEAKNSGIITNIVVESYVPFYMTIINHFQSYSFWLGSSFGGLVTAIIPSSLYAEKPPIDDGMYLYSICQGAGNIEPVMPFDSLNGSSYPLETFGAMYANFGILGVFLGMLLLGIIIGYFYRRMEKKHYNMLSVVMYTQVIFAFELSTLRIFQLFQTFIVLSFVVFCVHYLSIKSIINPNKR